jgi:hypothetical protein
LPKNHIAKESFMSELVLIDVTPVLLSCSVPSPEALDIHYEGTALRDSDLAIELDQQPAAAVAVTDFADSGETYRVSGFTVEQDGLLTPWPREGAEVRSPSWPLEPNELIVDALVDAVSYDDSLPPDEQAQYVPKTMQARIRIRVRKKGSKPYL